MSGGKAEGGAPSVRPLRAFFRLLGKALFYCSILCLLIGAAGSLGAYLIYDHVTGTGAPGEAVFITVREGATGREVGEELARAGLIERAEFFRLAIYLDKSKRPIKHGPYSLGRGLSPSQLLHELQEGPNRPVHATAPSSVTRLTFPEGLTVAQMAELLPNPEAFAELSRDEDLIARLGIEAETLEGFLMPNTYFFDGEPSERAVTERMLDQFQKEYAALIAGRENVEETNLLRIVTVASLVEEEARVDEERALIASVIYNRLERGRLLELDSTLQYALGKYGQRLLNEDKEVDSPYNTYKHAGLPPGPISNPGVASLRAALEPAESAYLYFVSNADGSTHTFSRTLREHNDAVARYRREMRRNRRELREKN